VWLDDQAVAGSIDDVCGYGFPQFATGVLPSSGPAFKPNIQGAFNGQNALGFWTLRVLDVAANNVGTLASWTVDFEDANGDLCDPQGACCVGSTCTQTGQSECATAGGTWTAGQACFDNFSSTTIPNLPIPDNNPTGISHVLNVGTAFQIADLNLRLVINHSWVGDLVVRLSHAGGPFVTVIDRPGVPATTFGCEGNNYDIVLDDEGLSAIENLCGQPNNPPSPPNYTPNNPLSFFDGQNFAGQWTLNVNDMDIGDVGTLVQWSLVAEDSETGFCVVVCPANIINTGTSAGRVDVDDLLAVISGWGDCPVPPTQCPANIVNTGTSANRVDVDDLLGVISAWGQCP
jgi:subtilisin-like proprotein convertase family protein